MANFRILSDNYIASSTMITAAVQKTGVVTNPIKDGTGKAVMLTTGAYTAGIDNQYKVQINLNSSGGLGAGATNAKFRWFRNDTLAGAGFDATTAFQTLENDVQVKWSSGLTSSTDAFGSTLDQWILEGKNLFGLNQMIDRKRNTRWRSSTNALELHTDSNAAADPGGVEVNSTGAWLAGGVFTSFHASTISKSAGLRSLFFTGATVAAGFHRLKINPDINGAAVYRLSYDARTLTGQLRQYFSDTATTVESKTFLTTNAAFESQTFNYVADASTVQINFNQLGTVIANWYVDNLSFLVLPGFEIKLSSAKKVDAVIIQDHNFTSNADITLKGRDDTSWELSTSTSEPVEETIAWQDKKILHYVADSSNTRRYWRLDISDTGNPDGYIEIGDLYFGSFDEMARNAAIEYTQKEAVIGSKNIDVYGVEDNRFRNRQKTWQYRLPVSTDIETLEGVFDNIYSSTSGKYDPVWINPTSNSTDFYMVYFDSLPTVHKFRNQSDITLNFREVLKSN